MLVAPDHSFACLGVLGMVADLGDHPSWGYAAALRGLRVRLVGDRALLIAGEPLPELRDLCVGGTYQ